MTGIAERARALNDRFRHHAASDVMAHALEHMGRIALVSSFGAESAVLLHMAAVIDRRVPVLFVDTGLLFTETLVYQAELCERLGLENLRILRPRDGDIAGAPPALYRDDPDACCAMRKIAPLRAALAGFDGWITGRKRFQSATRAALDFFEPDPQGARIKINPLAHWSARDLRTYSEENRLPRHPLVARGYPSIGCMPCTTPVRAGEDARAGRWRSRPKLECGLHLAGETRSRTKEKT